MYPAFDQEIDKMLQVFEDGRMDEGRRTLDTLVEFNSADMRLQQVGCMLAYMNKDWQTLLTLSRRALYFTPHNEEIQAMRGAAFEGLGRLHLYRQEAAVNAAADAWNTEEQGFEPHTGAETVADAGALYIAMDPKYVKEAALSAQTFKKHHPDIPCALITASECEEEAAFDHVIRVPRDFEFRYYFSDPKRMASIKVRYLRYSPFRKTLYLDSDTYVVKPLDAIFDRLDHADFMYFETPLARYTKTQGEKADEVYARGLACPYVPDSGVLAFRRSERMEHFFDKWFQRYIEVQSGPNRWRGNWGQGINDQAILMKMISEDVFRDTSLRVGCLPGWQYNSKAFTVSLIRKHGLFGHIHLLHANDIFDHVAAVGEDRLEEVALDYPHADFSFPLPGGM